MSVCMCVLGGGGAKDALHASLNGIVVVFCLCMFFLLVTHTGL